MTPARPLLLLLLAVSLPAAGFRHATGYAESPLRVRGDAPRWRLDPVAGPAGEALLAPAAARELEGLGWEAVVDPGTGLPLRAFGPPVAAEGGGSLPAAALAFLEAHPGLLGFRPGVDGIELVAGEPFRAGAARVVRIAQRWHGYPVVGVRADVRFAGGGVVMARLDVARGIDAARAPSIPGARAVTIAASVIRRAGRDPAGTARLDAAEPLVIVRHGDGWSLAWAVRAETAGPPPGRFTVWVDAIDGDPIAVRDEVRRGVVDTPLTLQTWHEPRRAGDTEVLSPLPFFAARDGQETFVTDSAGLAVVPVPGASRTLDLALDGDFVAVTLSGGSSMAAVQVDAGVPATFAWDAQTASPSERDAAVSQHVVRQRMRRMAPDLAWLDEKILVRVDVPGDGCNAFWSVNTALFYAENETCNATARLADVVYHEIGHGFHAALAGGGSVSADVGEGSADYLAATINGDPDIAPGFFKAQSEGLRNIEPDLVYPDDLDGEAHHDGLIWGGAFWDLRTRLVAALGSDAGVVLADVIFADTLRLGPVMDDGFWDALFAADDDGNVSNGGPWECEVVTAFGAHGLGPGDGLAIGHRPVGAQAPDAPGYPVRAHIAGAFPRCGATGIGSAEVEWRYEGESAWRSLPMHADLVPGWRTATIPPAPEGSVIEYRIRASDSNGGPATSPARGFDLHPFRFRVAAPRVIFEDDFESDRGWTHELVEGLDILGADDWQRGTPRGRSGDPSYAFSGTHVWGNDLGEDPFNGAYQGGKRNRLESPPIDCRTCVGTRLQFRRWLTVEEGQLDIASVWIDGRRVWANPLEERLRDQEWRFEDLDVSAVADGERFRIRFELKSSPGVNQGGWNIDDVRVTADGYYEPTGCACALAGPRPAFRGGLFAVLAALGIAVCVRRRGPRRAP